MKKTILFLTLLFTTLISYGQAFTNDRSSPSITVQDARYRARLNFYYPHTHGLTLNGGLDTLGAAIYDDSSRHIWYRDTVQGGGHKWTMVSTPADAPSLSLKQGRFAVGGTGNVLTPTTTRLRWDSINSAMQFGPGSMAFNPYLYDTISGSKAFTLRWDSTVGMTWNVRSNPVGLNNVIFNADAVKYATNQAASYDARTVPDVNYVDSLTALLQRTAQKGQANGYASLNGSGIVPAVQKGLGGVSNSQFLAFDDTYKSIGAWIFFQVGEPSFPQNGDSLYTYSSLQNYTDFAVYREGLAQYIDTADGFQPNNTVGQVIFHPPLMTGEHIIIRACYNQPLRSGAFVTFNVNTVPNVLGWYDVTDPTTITVGTGVSQLRDKTPNHSDLVQATPGNQPSYNTSGGSNNAAYIGFTGGKSLTYTLGSPINGAITVYMAMQNPTLQNTGRVYSFRVSGGVNGLSAQNVFGVGGLGPYWSFFTYDGVGSGSFDINASFGDWMSLKSVFRGGGVGFQNVNKLGGYGYGAQHAGAGTPGSLPMDYITFGDGVSAFKLSEAIVIKGEPSPTDDANIKSYLISKYNLPQRPFLFMFGDSHTAGIESGSPIGNFYSLVTQTANGIDEMNMAVPGTVAYPIGSYGGITGLNLSDQYNTYDNYITENLANTYVAFQYGTNDGTSPTNPTWVTNYTAYVQHFLSLGLPASHIIMCTPPYNSNPVYLTNLTNAVPVIQGIANSLGVKYCNFFGAVQAAGLDCFTVPGGDGIHGNDPIHAVMASLLETFLP